MKEPTHQQMEVTFQSLPDWMRKAYDLSPEMNQVVKRLLYSSATKEQIIDTVAQIFFNRSKDLFDKLVKLSSSRPPLIIT